MSKLFSLETELDVTLVSAKNLKAADIGGKSDPYVVLYTGSDNSMDDVVNQKSPVIQKELNPVWNHHFRRISLSPQSVGNYASARVVVYDKDKIGSDDYLGEAHFIIPRDQVKHNNTVTLTEKLVAGQGRKEKEITGEVTLKLIILMPAALLEGATFTFSGVHEVTPFALINNQNPATKWQGKGTITMQSEKAKLTFTEIKRECFQAPGKPWIHDKPATFEVDGRDATMEIPDSKQWESRVVFTAKKLTWSDDLSKLEMEIVDLEKYFAGKRDTAGTWKFDITPKK